MAISLKHAFQSLKSDGTDPTQVQPSHWNAQHQLTLAGGNLVGRLTNGTGAAEEIPISTFMAEALAAPDANAFLAALGIGGFTSGDVKLSFSSTAEAGWIAANTSGSIGNATSAATIRANEDTKSLFTKLWDNIPDAYCPVSGGRGGSAALDFDAGKRLTIPELKGRSPIGVGKSSVAGGITWVAGGIDGENVHTLSVTNIPSHVHSSFISDPQHQHSGVAVGSTPSTTGGGAFTVVGALSIGNTNLNYTGIVLTNVAAGGGGAHNTVHPVTAMYYHIKL